MTTPYEISRMKDALFFMPPEEKTMAEQMAREKRQAAALAAHAAAYRSMPEDLRAQAKTWGLEAFVQVVWMSAWENGYRQAVRDANETRDITK